MNRRVLIALALVGCVEPAEPIEPQVTSRVVRHEMPIGNNRDIDLLFVIDNSPAMAPHRDNVLANLRRFVDVIDTIPEGRPDLHIGVVTTDVGTRGANDPSPTPPLGACTSDGDAGALHTRPSSIMGNFISDVKQSDGTRVRNYTGDLHDVFAALGDVGTDGCPATRPLEAVRRAFKHPDNYGFVRPDAYFAVIFITPGDDCSFANASFLAGDVARCMTNASELLPVAEFEQLLKELKPDPTKVLVSGVLRPDTPRLGALLDLFPNRSARASIDAADHSDALSHVAQFVKTSLGAPCLAAPLADLDPARPGKQLDCAVWIEFPSLAGDGTDQRVLKPCELAHDGPPCWHIRLEPQICIEHDHESIHVLKAGVFPPVGVLVSECVAR